MKKILLTLFAAMLALPSLARDIEYPYEGQTLTYTVINEEAKTVRTKSGDYGSSAAGNEVSGNLVIPSQITDGDEIYEVIEIGNYAFRNCSGLTSITIPGSLTSIGQQAFRNCIGLTSITIPGSVTSIGELAFSGCSGLTSITIPESVTSIGQQAFSSCSGLTSITIPGPVTSISEWVFYDCSGLTSITIPGSVTSIGKMAFCGCSCLTSITIPENVTSIGEMAFRRCSGLTYAEFASIDALCSISFSDGEANPLNYAHKLYIDGKEVTSITIPESVSSIGNYAFRNCSGLTSVTIPESVSSIGEYAFCGCSGLTSITIPESVTEIGRYAFCDCSGLTSITIPESVKEIGLYAFYSCSGLTSITIPESVTEIKGSAFGDCRSLTAAILLPSEVKISESAFSNCNSNMKCAYSNTMDNPFSSDIHAIAFDRQTSIVDNYTIYGPGRKSILFVPYNETGEYAVRSTVTEIGAGAYSYLPNLKTIEIPNDVTSIGNNAFANCKALETVILPMKLETLGSAVFENSSKIKNVVFNGPTPVESTSDVFDSKVYEDATLYVRSGRQTLFMAVSPWKFFYNITDAAYSGVEDVIADFNEDAPCEVFNLNGVKVGESTDNLPSGIYIVRQGNNVKKIAVK